MLLLSLLPEPLLADLVAEWIDPEADLRAVAELLGADTFARLVAPPGFQIQARKILSEAGVAWLAARGVRVAWLRSFVVTEDDDAQCWFQNGQAHRENDLPAEIWIDGTRVWYQHGKIHRDGDRPAIEWASGARSWYQHGKQHRDNDDLPAKIGADGARMWYKHGRRHRDGDQPAVEHVHYREWYQHDRQHRDGDQPAYMAANGDREWWVHGVKQLPPS